MNLSGSFSSALGPIIQKIKDRVVASAEGPLRFVVMDFRRVSGIDSSTILSFDRLRRLAQKDGFTVILTQLQEQTAARLRASGLDISAAPYHQEPDIDAGVSGPRMAY